MVLLLAAVRGREREEEVIFILFFMYLAIKRIDVNIISEPMLAVGDQHNSRISERQALWPLALGSCALC
jgi:hypothetical protein